MLVENQRLNEITKVLAKRIEELETQVQHKSHTKTIPQKKQETQNKSEYCKVELKVQKPNEVDKTEEKIEIAIHVQEPNNTQMNGPKTETKKKHRRNISSIFIAGQRVHVMKMHYQEGIHRIMEGKPKSALQYLFNNRFIKNDTKEIARFLFNIGGVIKNSEVYEIVVSVLIHDLDWKLFWIQRM